MSPIREYWIGQRDKYPAFRLTNNGNYEWMSKEDFRHFITFCDLESSLLFRDSDRDIYVVENVDAVDESDTYSIY